MADKNFPKLLFNGHEVWQCQVACFGPDRPARDFYYNHPDNYTNSRQEYIVNALAQHNIIEALRTYSSYVNFELWGVKNHQHLYLVSFNATLIHKPDFYLARCFIPHIYDPQGVLKNDD